MHLKANPPTHTAFKNIPNPKFPKFAMTIVFEGAIEGSSQGDWNVSRICQILSENSSFSSNIDKHLTHSSPPNWSPRKQSSGQLWGFGVFLEYCKGSEKQNLEEDQGRGLP